MKNLTFLALALFLSSNIFAQKGVKIGLQFTPGASLSLQNEDFDRGEDLNLSGAFGWNMGLTVGYGFSETFSLSTGLMFSNHQSKYVHDRQFFNSTSTADPNYKKTFTKNLGYIRIPLLLEVGSSPDQSAGFFFRFGPHFDFMTGGKYKDERLEGFSRYDSEKGLDLMGQTALWAPSSDKKTSTKTNQTDDIYNKVVIGLSVDIGGQIKLVDNLKMILTLHLETSLTNPEGVGASSYSNNISDEVFAENLLSADGISDGLKALSDRTPFDAMYPNYISEDRKGATHRDAPFNVMGGFTIGFIYTIPVD